MGNNVELSIITICLNNRKGLEKTLASLYRQTYKKMEVWVIDGGSEDGSLDTIKDYNEKFNSRGQSFRYITEPDTGIYNAMNKGIQRASGEWIVFMNAGDMPASDSIYDEILRKNDYKEYDIIYGDRFLAEKKEKIF